MPEHLVGAGTGVDPAGLEHHADAGVEFPGLSHRVEAQDAYRAGIRLPVPSQVSTVVVLPAPLGPSTAVMPASATRSRPSTAVLSPYRFTRAWTWTTGSLRMRRKSREPVG